MLRINKLIDYGMLVLTHMTGDPQRLYSVPDLSAALGLGRPTVSKVLKLLARRGLVHSVRGAQGGYALSRPAEQINLAQVVDALEDQPFGLTECSATPGACSLEPGCTLRRNWQQINAVVRRTLEDVSVADMARPMPLPWQLPVVAQARQPDALPTAN